MRKLIILLGVCIFLISFEPAYASPGGRIASIAFETFWGKIAFVGLMIIFLPIIVSVIIQENLAEKRARKDLRFMAEYSVMFDWLKIQERVKSCFYRVHSSWENEDLSNTSEWMTEWYWQNQQQLHLEKWKKNGLQNVCEIKKIKSIQPLLFVHRNQGYEHEDSMVAISITAEMKDYLQNKNTGKIVEGSKKLKDVHSVWTLTLTNGKWKVSDISSGNASLSFAKLRSELPPIETTVFGNLNA